MSGFYESVSFTDYDQIVGSSTPRKIHDRPTTTVTEQIQDSPSDYQYDLIVIGSGIYLLRRQRVKADLTI